MRYIYKSYSTFFPFLTITPFLSYYKAIFFALDINIFKLLLLKLILPPLKKILKATKALEQLARLLIR